MTLPRAIATFARVHDDPRHGGLTVPARRSRGNAFGATPKDLSPFGYDECEYLISGEAVGSDDGGAPGPGAFATRFLVRRPTDPARFNGTVVVEWLNVSAGFDISCGWGTFQSLLVREGYAFVGVTAQPLAIEYLRQWDPVAYGSLTHPWTPIDPRPLFVTGETWSASVFAIVGQALLSHGEACFGRRPSALLAYGNSQSCGALAGYLGDVAARTPDANPYAGFLLHSGGPMPLPYWSSYWMATMGQVMDDSLVSPLVDVRVPVVHVNSEAEAVGAVAGPDDNENYRFWEVAGTHHGTTNARYENLEIFRRDVPAMAVAPFGGDGILPPVSCFDDVLRAALDHLARWVAGEGAPPSAGRIEVERVLDAAIPAGPDVPVSGQLVELARDEHGNALGGVRMPHVEVPIGQQLHTGGFRPFPPDRLVELYGTEDAFRKRLYDACERAVERGFLLRSDAEPFERAYRSLPVWPG